MGRGRLWVMLALAAVVVLLAGTTSGRQWLEDRMETVRWFINEVRTLHPSLAPP